MRDLIRQIQNGLANNLYYLSLFVSLSLPDICGALESNDGQANKIKYIEWFDNNVAPKYLGKLSGEDCYYYRCSLLHQGSSNHSNSTYERIIFIEPTATEGNIFHNNILKDALNIDLNVFCEDIIQGVEIWLNNMEHNTNYKKNKCKCMKRYPNGLPPYIVGIPIIA